MPDPRALGSQLFDPGLVRSSPHGVSPQEPLTPLAALNEPFRPGLSEGRGVCAAGPLVHFELGTARLESSADLSCFGSRGPSQSCGVCRAGGMKFPFFSHCRSDRLHRAFQGWLSAAVTHRSPLFSKAITWSRLGG